LTYRVRLSAGALEDLERLYDFILERELVRDGGDLDLADRAIEAIGKGLRLLERFPFTCRKAGDSSFVRELLIPFGHTGCVALFEIVDSERVIVSAVRHQREGDYH
jgi:plasmid stabilization system protein ParE